MKLLSSSAEINRELLRLIEECSTCRLAVAWASVGFPTFEALQRERPKIDRTVVGTHFYQTHPDFIEHFREHPNFRFILKPDGVFHPKIYLFFIGEARWECVIGSANFTQGGLNRNYEVASLITNHDVGAEQMLPRLIEQLDLYWDAATPISESDLQAYREFWHRKQPIINELGGRFGNLRTDNSYDGGKAPLEVPILRTSWPAVFDAVSAERQRDMNLPRVEERLEVVRAVKRFMSSGKSFHQLDERTRQQIAGLVRRATTTETNFLWFGSMKGTGHFQHAVKAAPEKLSTALDQIPAAGPVSREAYIAFVHHFREALPQKVFVAPASRLLAMKRPDYFVCLDGRNKRELCAAFAVPPKIGYEEYWDSIIERVKEATWWNSLPPSNQIEREVWEARAAFLDALYYDGKDIPDSLTTAD